MGVDAIPQQFGAAANVIPLFYVDSVLINGSAETMTAAMGHRLLATEAKTTVVVGG